jgi:integrase
MATIVKGKNANKPYTVRYQDNGRQREKSFRTSREANDFRAKFEHDSRAGIFVDPKAGGLKFSEVAKRWVETRTGAPSSRETYDRILRNHINPLIGHKTIRWVAQERYAIEELLKVTLPKRGLGASQVRTAYIVIRAVVNDAIRAGKLGASRINGITLPAAPVRANVVFATHEQVQGMADAMPGQEGLALWLMRGCGLRIGEALAVRWENFNVETGTLRITEQLNEDGTYTPLKHRSEGDYRDMPVPVYVNHMAVKHTSDDIVGRYGYVFPEISRRNFSRHFNKARDSVGLPSDFTPHTLRHIFASVSLSNRIPITDVSAWLGHRNINLTYSIYGHLVPSSVGNARVVLDAEYDDWRLTA